ncbi:MAG: DUF3748 domain-containing protein [Sphingobacteriales bacterium]|nr:DUF3748 domain-containing protein [Sphingobacteriales bacterium]
MKFREIQLTNDAYGHTIHNTQVFSGDDQWIVYDTRNDDTKIAETNKIEMVNVQTGAILELYATQNQSQFGPGVGAATFSPQQDIVLFIHGIRNANSQNPYSITRRTGVAVDIHHPGKPIFMDARNIQAPYTPGALRGGTHAHTWSGDGQWISFTYNDYVLEQLSKTDSSIKDSRTVGVIAPQPVEVKTDDDSLENFSGKMFSVVAAEVVSQPKWGSDEIDKAFDETWIGNGYINRFGNRQKNAIAFQGNVRDNEGKIKTEVFVLDLPVFPFKSKLNKPLQGTSNTHPNVPEGFHQRRVTFTKNGIEGPRHWLRTTGDGELIAFLAKDTDGIIQIFGVSPNGGSVIQISKNKFSVEGPFNFSPNDKFIAYTADNSIFITEIQNGNTQRITKRFEDWEKPLNAPVWSYKGDRIAYNRKVKFSDGEYIQIFILEKMDK